jgi:hypothetical protein
MPYTLAITSYIGPMRLIRSDGTTEAELQCQPNCDYEVATWSRDGTQLALEGVGYRNGEVSSVLYTASADGSSPVEIATSPSYCTGSHGSCSQYHYRKFDVDWSTDGRLVYALDDTSLVVSAADGSEKRILLSDANGVRKPRWGTGDHTITFISTSTRGLFAVQSTDGSGIRPVGSVWLEEYDWSPDRSTIAVQGLVVGSVDDRALYLVDPATGQSAPIVGAIEGFAWSPLGDEIAIVRGDSLLVVNTRGASTFLRRGNVARPVWSPDAHSLIVIEGEPVNAVSEIGRATLSRRTVLSGGLILKLSEKQGTRWNGYFEYVFH